MAQWPTNINQNFYGLDGAPEENRKEIKFKSGRKIYYKINSIGKKNHSVKLRLNDSLKIDGKTEFEKFLDWYENENGSGTVPIELKDLESKNGTKDYYITVQNWNGQKYKEVSLRIEEI